MSSLSFRYLWLALLFSCTSCTGSFNTDIFRYLPSQDSRQESRVHDPRRHTTPRKKAGYTFFLVCFVCLTPADAALCMCLWRLLRVYWVASNFLVSFFVHMYAGLIFLMLRRWKRQELRHLPVQYTQRHSLQQQYDTLTTRTFLRTNYLDIR